MRRYLRGWYPELGGILHMGWQGEETIVECDVIKPVGRIRVAEASINSRHLNSHNGHQLGALMPGG